MTPQEEILTDYRKSLIILSNKQSKIVVKLNSFLKRSGIGKVEFSRMLGCPHCTVSRWVNGHCKISPAWAYRINEFIKNWNKK